MSEDQRINALHQLAILDTPAEECFDAIVDLACRVMKAPIAAIAFADRNRLWFKAKRGICDQEADLRTSFCKHVVDCSMPIVVGDLARDPRFCASPLVTSAERVCAYAGFPIELRDGHVIGALCVQDKRPRRFSSGQIECLRALASQVSKLLELRLEVAARRQAEEASVTSQQQAEDVIKSIGGIFAVIAPNGIVSRANEAAKAYFGLTSGQYAGLAFARSVSRERCTWLERTLADQANSKSNHIDDLEVTTETGESRAVSLSLWPMSSESEACGGYLLLASDVTERQRQEHDRKRFQQVLSMLSTSLIGLPSECLDEAIQRALQIICEFVSMDRGSVILASRDTEFFKVEYEWTNGRIQATDDRTWRSQYDFPWLRARFRAGQFLFIHDVNDLPEDAAEERALFFGRGFFSVLFQPLVSGGKTLGALSFASSTFVAEMSPERLAMIRMASDIVANALARQEFDSEFKHGAQAALAESEHRLVAVLAHAPVVLISVNGDGVIDLAVGGRVHPWEGSWHALVGSKVCDAFSSKPQVVEEFTRAIAGEELESTHVFGTRTFSMRFAATEGQGRSTSGAICVALDVTEHDEMQRQLSLSMRMEGVGRLASGIAHEINTPIQFVCSNLQFLHSAFKDRCRVITVQRELVSAARQFKELAPLVAQIEAMELSVDLAYIETEIPIAISQGMEGVKRVADIVKGMKTLAHPGGAAMEMCDLNEAIVNTMTVCRNEYKHVADLMLELDPSLPKVRCHVAEINQAILNLLINAAHAIQARAASSGERGKIVVRTQATLGTVSIDVADTGGGIPDDVKDCVFEPFFTTKPAGQGTGQGLSIVHAIMCRHGGTVSFESDSVSGTTFHLKLPLQSDYEFKAVA